MSLNIKYWRAKFPPKLKTLIYELICVFFLNPATIKNENGAFAMSIFLCDANRSNNYINLKKDDIRE